MDGDGAPEFAGDAELAEKYRILDGDGGCCDPFVEAALADGGGRVFFQQFAKPVLPAGGGGVCFPRVDAEGGGDEARVPFGEGFDDRPVGLAGGVDDAAGDSGGAHGGDDGFGISESRVVEVVVGVETKHLVSAVRVVRRSFARCPWTRL